MISLIKRIVMTLPSLIAAALALALAACTNPGSMGLVPGQSDLSEVIRRLGEPRMQWSEYDGSRLLAYPGGPSGVRTYMVKIGKDGKLQRLENVMSAQAFGRIEAGMSKDQVLHILGPSQPSWTVYFAARNELVWEWPYCDDWNRLARFDVLFDGTKEVVRSTMSRRIECGMRDGGCWCSH